MKCLLILLASLSLCLSRALAQDSDTNTPVRIRAVQARMHLNKKAVVTGNIAEVNKAEKVVRLNFEKPFPNQLFTAVIFARHTNLFPNLEALKGKTVEVSGTITDYRNRPEIIITRTNQLRVPEKTGAEN